MPIWKTAVLQIKALASLDGDEMFANFDTTIDQFSDFEAYIARLLNAWRTGDLEVIGKHILASLRDTSPSAFSVLITKRNAKWSDHIDNLMAGAGDYFIAVGAGHLVGEDSVVDMLRAKGHEVKRVQ